MRNMELFAVLVTLSISNLVAPARAQSDADYLQFLQGLRPLPKVHPCTTSYGTWDRDPSPLMREVSRISGCVSINPWAVDRPGFDRACKLATDLSVPLALNIHPWGYRVTTTAPSVLDSSVLSDQTAFSNMLSNARTWSSAAGVSVRWVFADQERWRLGFDFAENAALVAKLEWSNREILGNFPGASVDWYAAGQQVVDAYGWRTDSYGAEKITALDALSCNLYELWNPELMAQKVIHTRQAAAAAGKPFVTPVISLGWSWYPRWVDPTHWDSTNSWVPHRHRSGDLWLLSAALNYPGWRYPGNSDIRTIWIHQHPLASDNPYGLREFSIWAAGARETPLPAWLRRDPAGADLDGDGDVDQDDFSILQRCRSGAGVPADPRCLGN